ncbi:MAG: hypothetical protein KAV99_00460 [Candidatus Latescibacteria bacterium]|nr:hypothetical protein [Candidatus Latescibacterota bacterium]
MSFNWRDYVDLAEELLNREEEACLRSSISRAYYGAFCIARNRKGYKNYTGADIHWKVIDEYKNSSDRNEQDIGRILDKLRRSRNKADYNEDRPISKPLAERAVTSANQILANVRIP